MSLGEKIGEGQTSEIFAWGAHQVVKLFRSDQPAGNVDYEYNIARAVQDAALNAPFVGERVEIDGRLGIVYERVDGDSLLRRLSTHPWQMLGLARQFAEAHTLVHERSTNALPDVKTWLTAKIRRAPHLDNVRAEILRRLDALPDGETICHGDFHPDNVILSPRGLVVIDWTNAVRGDYLADVARTSIMLTLSPLSSPLMRVFRNAFYAVYLRRYRQLRPFNHADLARWLLPVAAARLDERIPGEETALLNLIQTAIR